MGRNRDLDFVFYSLESGPFDIMSTKVYMEGVAEGSGENAPHPLILRIPPIRNGVAEAEAHAAEALAAGVAGIVFPHAESAEDAAVAVSVMGDDLWPGNPSGALLSILIVEDAAAVDRVDEIVATPGVSVVFAGPGDLRRAYQGDMEAVEGAIRQVLAAWPAPWCAVRGSRRAWTTSAARIEQGFRVFHRGRSGRRDGGEGGGGAGVGGPADAFNRCRSRGRRPRGPAIPRARPSGPSAPRATVQAPRESAPGESPPVPRQVLWFVCLSQPCLSPASPGPDVGRNSHNMATPHMPDEDPCISARSSASVAVEFAASTEPAVRPTGPPSIRSATPPASATRSTPAP